MWILPSPAAARLLALVLGAAIPLTTVAHAQDGSGAEPAAAPAAEPPAAHPPGVETTEAWERFSRALADQLRRQGRIPDAVEEYVAVAALRPNDLDVVADAAVMLVDHATDIAHALQERSPYVVTTESLVQMGVARGGIGDCRLAYVIGRLRLAEGENGIAVEMLSEALRGGFDPARLRRWLFIATVNDAPAMLKEGRADDVIAQLEALIEEQPDHPEVLEAKVNLAAAYRRNNDRVRSEAILEELSVRYPQDHRPWLGLGREHFDQGRLEEALAAYRKALALSGSDRESYSQALASMAVVLYKLARLDESEQAAQQFMELDGKSAAGLHLLAMLRRDRGDTLEAIKLLRRADLIMKDDPGILTLLEQIHYQRGELEEAEAVRKRREALNAEPEEAPEDAPDGATEREPAVDDSDAD